MVRQAEHKQRMIEELERLQDGLKRDWIDKSLPRDWNALDYWHPIEPDKTRVTLRLDADMVRWFRKLGPGYQKRINQVLRVYWTALLSGDIHARHKDDTIPRIHLAAQAVLDAHDRNMAEYRAAQARRDPTPL